MSWYDNEHHGDSSVMKTSFSGKPRKCPNCGSRKIAAYLYGMPAYTPDLEKELQQGTIALGGCSIGAEMPEWVCIDCKTDLFKAGRLEKIP
jgi:hypothetical protein